MLLEWLRSFDVARWRCCPRALALAVDELYSHVIVVTIRPRQSTATWRCSRGRPQRGWLSAAADDRWFRWRFDASAVAVVLVDNVSSAGRRSDKFRNPPSTHRALRLCKRSAEYSRLSHVASSSTAGNDVTHYRAVNKIGRTSAAV